MTTTFTRRQRVRVLAYAGPRFVEDWSEKATVIGQHPAPFADMYVIQFDHGGAITSPASRLMADNEPAFKGRLPTYASTQR